MLPVCSTAPTANQILQFNATTGQYCPANGAGGGQTFPPSNNLSMGGYDLTNLATANATGEALSYGQSMTTSLADVCSTAPTSNQILTFNGSLWCPASGGGGGQTFPPSNNLSMGGFLLTNEGCPVANGEPEVEHCAIGATTPAAITGTAVTGTSLNISGSTAQSASVGNFLQAGNGDDTIDVTRSTDSGSSGLLLKGWNYAQNATLFSVDTMGNALFAGVLTLGSNIVGNTGSGANAILGFNWTNLKDVTGFWSSKSGATGPSSVCNGSGDDSGAINAALAAGVAALPARSTCVITSGITISKSQTGLICMGPTGEGSCTISTASNSIPMVTISIASATGDPEGRIVTEIKGIQFIRTGITSGHLPTSTAYGIVQTPADPLDAAVIEDVFVTNSYVGISLAGVQLGYMHHVTSVNNLSDGILLADGGVSNGSLAWTLETVWSGDNAGSGIHAKAGQVAITLAPWNSVQTYLNTGYGIWIDKNTSYSFFGLQIANSLDSSSSLDGIYLDAGSAGTVRNNTLIDNFWSEVAGGCFDPGVNCYGPSFQRTTSASCLGNGIELGTNLDAQITESNIVAAARDAIIVNTSAGGAGQINITGGILQGNGACQGGATLQSGIYVGNSNDVLITGIKAYNNGNGHQLWGYYNANDQEASAVGNDFCGNASNAAIGVNHTVAVGSGSNESLWGNRCADSANSPTSGTSYVQGITTFEAAVNLNAQIASAITTGTAPFTVQSTTPVVNLTASPPFYTHTGSQYVNSFCVIDNGTIGGGGTDTVNLTGAAIFPTNLVSCTATDRSGTALPVGCQAASLSQLVFTGTPGDTFYYMACGN